MALFQAMLDATQVQPPVPGTPADASSAAPETAKTGSDAPRAGTAAAVLAPSVTADALASPAGVDAVPSLVGVDALSSQPATVKPTAEAGKTDPKEGQPPTLPDAAKFDGGPAAVLASLPSGVTPSTAQIEAPKAACSRKSPESAQTKAGSDAKNDEAPAQTDDTSAAAALAASAAVLPQTIAAPTAAPAAATGSGAEASAAAAPQGPSGTAPPSGPPATFAAAAQAPALIAGLAARAAARTTGAKGTAETKAADAAPEAGAASSDAPLAPEAAAAKPVPSSAHPGAVSNLAETLQATFAPIHRDAHDAPRGDASSSDMPSASTLLAGTSGTSFSTAQPANGGTASAVAATASAGAAPEQAVPLSGVPVLIATRALAGERQFDIRLDPPELGRIEVRLKVDKEGQISSHLVADRADTLNLLRRDEAGLQRALQDAGLKTNGDGLQFSLRDQGGGQNDGRALPRTAATTDDAPLPREHAPRSYVQYSGRLGGLDIRV